MNICIVAPRYPYNDNMEFVFVKRLVDEWAKLGHTCVVVTFFSLTTYWRGRISFRPYQYQYCVSPGSIVQVYHPRTISLGTIAINRVSLSSWINSLVFKRLMAKKGLSFDFMYCHFFSSALCVYKYARNNDIPLFVATGESEIPKQFKPFDKFKIEDFRNYTKGVIAVSSKNKKEAVERNLIEIEKCKVFPNGTDLDIFHPMDRQECRNRLNLPQDAFIVSCVGFICERKGQNRLLDAVRKLHDKKVKLLILGKEAKVESFALEGEEILFKGAVMNQELPTYLCASDVFCLPTRAEGCCNAVIEALACGLPVISSDLPFNWDVLDNSNSVLVNPDKVEEIISALMKLRDDKELRTLLSEGALSKSTDLSLSERASSILSFVQDQIEKS